MYKRYLVEVSLYVYMLGHFLCSKYMMVQVKFAKIKPKHITIFKKKVNISSKTMKQKCKLVSRIEPDWTQELDYWRIE